MDQVVLPGIVVMSQAMMKVFIKRLLKLQESGMKMSDPTKKSRKLSKVLRHDPGSVGLVLDKAGWCDVFKLLNAMRMTQEELDFVVDNNNKKRFEYSPDKTKIRASQGHSVEVELDYQPMEPPQ